MSSASLLRRIQALEKRVSAKAQAKASHVMLCNQSGELLPGQELPDQTLSYLKRIILTHQVGSYE